MAEWLRNALYLEIESVPDGSMAYYITGWGLEYEGLVDVDDVGQLKDCAKLLGDLALVGVA